MSVLQERARVAALTRSRSSDDPELIDARRNLTAERLAAAISRAVESAPPLTPDQRSRLALLLIPENLVMRTESQVALSALVDRIRFVLAELGQERSRAWIGQAVHEWLRNDDSDDFDGWLRGQDRNPGQRVTPRPRRVPRPDLTSRAGQRRVGPRVTSTEVHDLVRWANAVTVPSCRQIGQHAVARVLIQLAAHADDRGRAWPSQETLADEISGLTRRDVRHALELLETADLISRSGKVRRAQVYSLNVPNVAGEPAITSDQDGRDTPPLNGRGDGRGNGRGNGRDIPPRREGKRTPTRVRGGGRAGARVRGPSHRGRAQLPILLGRHPRRRPTSHVHRPTCSAGTGG